MPFIHWYKMDTWVQVCYQCHHQKLEDIQQLKTWVQELDNNKKWSFEKNEKKILHWCKHAPLQVISNTLKVVLKKYHITNFQACGLCANVKKIRNINIGYIQFLHSNIFKDLRINKISQWIVLSLVINMLQDLNTIRKIFKMACKK